VRSSRAAVGLGDVVVGAVGRALRSALVAEVGLLIQTSVGTAAGRGMPRTKRSGWAACAAARTVVRSSTTVWARPAWTASGVWRPRPLW
jgi:hypothetical protein